MKKKVVIVVPIYKDLSSQEKRTLDFLRKNIKKHDKVIVSPINFDLSKIDTKDFQIKRLSPGRFKTKKTGLALLMSKRFYTYFEKYEYMLHVKPGSIVFGNDNDLDEWVDKNFSYIGAPWFRKNRENRRSLPGGVGKGALSLRKISDFIDIFSRKKMALKPHNLQSKSFFLEWRYWNRLKRYGAWIHLQQVIRPKRNAVHQLIRKFDKKEDLFWAFFAVQLNRKFKIPSFDDGYKFAIENTPYKVYEDTLPFGITDKAYKKSKKWDKIIEAHLPKKDVVKKAPVKKKAISKKKVVKKAPAKKKVVKKAPAKKKVVKKAPAKKAVVKKKAPAKKVAAKKVVSKKRTTKKKSIKS